MSSDTKAQVRSQEGQIDHGCQIVLEFDLSRVIKG